MSGSESKKILHLTNAEGSWAIFNAARENRFEYIKHSGPPEMLNPSDFKIIVKDRYPFDIKPMYKLGTPIISLLPANVMLVQGKNALLKCVVQRLPFARSIFLLRSNRYEIVPLEISLHEVQHDNPTFRSLFDEIFRCLHLRVSTLLADSALLENLGSFPSTKVNVDRSDLSKLLDDVSFAQPPFSEGYDTKISDVAAFRF